MVMARRRRSAVVSPGMAAVYHRWTAGQSSRLLALRVLRGLGLELFEERREIGARAEWLAEP